MPSEAPTAERRWSLHIHFHIVMKGNIKHFPYDKILICLILTPLMFLLDYENVQVFQNFFPHFAGSLGVSSAHTEHVNMSDDHS